MNPMKEIVMTVNESWLEANGAMSDAGGDLSPANAADCGGNAVDKATIKRLRREKRDARGRIVSGFPRGPGRPKGSTSVMTRLRQVFDKEVAPLLVQVGGKEKAQELAQGLGPALYLRACALALEGDGPMLLKLLKLQQRVPAREIAGAIRDLPLDNAMDVADVTREIAAQVALGIITPATGKTLTGMVDKIRGSQRTAKRERGE